MVSRLQKSFIFLVEDSADQICAKNRQKRLSREKNDEDFNLHRKRISEFHSLQDIEWVSYFDPII